MIVADAIQSALSIMLMISIGYVLTHKGWFDDQISRLFSKLVIRVSLPALVFSNLIITFDKKMLMDSGIGILIPLGSMILSLLIGRIIGEVLKIKSERMGLFMGMFALSNTIFIGLPVNIALFGDKSVPYVLLYYMANTTIFWTIGVYCIRQDRGEGSLFTWDNVKRIFSPPLMGFVVALIFIFLNGEPPKFIMDTCKYIGNLTTPLSMLFIGIVIHSIDLKDIRFDVSMVILMMGRFLFCPLLVFVLVNYFSIPELMKKVFVMEAAMPVMTQTAIVAQAYGADYKYATVMVSVTTVGSLLVIPLYSILLTIF